MIRSNWSYCPEAQTGYIVFKSFDIQVKGIAASIISLTLYNFNHISDYECDFSNCLTHTQQHQKIWSWQRMSFVGLDLIRSHKLQLKCIVKPRQVFRAPHFKIATHQNAAKFMCEPVFVSPGYSRLFCSAIYNLMCGIPFCEERYKRHLWSE